MSDKVIENEISSDEDPSDEDPSGDVPAEILISDDEDEKLTYEQLLEQIESLKTENKKLKEEAARRAEQHGTELQEARREATKMSDDNNNKMVQDARDIRDKKVKEAEEHEKKAKVAEERKKKVKKTLRTVLGTSAQQKIEIEELKAMVDTLRNEKTAAELKGEEAKKHQKIILENVRVVESAVQMIKKHAEALNVMGSDGGPTEPALGSSGKQSEIIADSHSLNSITNSVNPVVPKKITDSSPAPPSPQNDSLNPLLPSDADVLNDVVVEPKGEPTNPVVPSRKESEVPENPVDLGPEDNMANQHFLANLPLPLPEQEEVEKVVEKNLGEPPKKRFKALSTGATPFSDGPSTTPPNGDFIAQSRALMTGCNTTEEAISTLAESSKFSGIFSQVQRNYEDERMYQGTPPFLSLDALNPNQPASLPIEDEENKDEEEPKGDEDEDEEGDEGDGNDELEEERDGYDNDNKDDEEDEAEDDTAVDTFTRNIETMKDRMQNDPTVRKVYKKEWGVINCLWNEEKPHKEPQHVTKVPENHKLFRSWKKANNSPLEWDDAQRANKKWGDRYNLLKEEQDKQVRLGIITVESRSRNRSQ